MAVGHRVCVGFGVAAAALFVLVWLFVGATPREKWAVGIVMPVGTAVSVGIGVAG